MSSQPAGDAERPDLSAGQAEGVTAAGTTEPAGPAPGASAAAGAAGRDTTGRDTTGRDTTDADAGAAAADAGRATIVLDPESAESGETAESAGTAEWAEAAAAPGAEPVSKLAVAALIASVITLVPVAVACGIAALIGIRRTGRRGHGMAVAALFVSAGWVIIVGAVGAVGALTHGFQKPVTVKYHESAVFKLREGDCVNTAGGQNVSVLPCSTPHQAEVFATFTLPASAWPGTAAVKREASSGCVSRLTGYLNPQLAISLVQSYVFPDKVAWTAGTRTVICEVRATSGDLTGSVRGAA